MRIFEPEQLEHMTFISGVLDEHLTAMDGAPIPPDRAATLEICRLANMLPITDIDQEIERLEPYQPAVLEASKIAAKERMEKIIAHSQQLGTLLPFARESIEGVADELTAELGWTLDLEPNDAEEQSALVSLKGIQETLHRLSGHEVYPSLLRYGLEVTKKPGVPQGEASRAMVGYLSGVEIHEVLDHDDLLNRIFPDCPAEHRRRNINYIRNMLNPKQASNAPIRTQLRQQDRIIQRGKAVEIIDGEYGRPTNVYRILSLEDDTHLSTGEDVYEKGKSLIVWEAVSFDE